MNEKLERVYVCPKTKTALSLLRLAGETGSEIASGELVSTDGIRYPIEAGIPYFIFPDQLSEMEIHTQHQYDHVYTEEFYKNAIDWQFGSLYEDEERVREAMVDRLDLQSDSRVLEIGCGTGMDSFRIAKRLGTGGTLFLQDLSRRMVSITQERLSRDYKELGLACNLNFFVSSGTYLPFPDDYFDALFHFGGFNNFARPKESFAEFARVVKQGGKVVVGDEAIAPWLADSEFGRIVCTNNPLFSHQAPLQHLPASARGVTVQWILGNCFYLIAFVVAEGPPPLNLDLPHKGRRGGTMRSRYYGQLEGVTVETKEKAWAAVAKKGVSMHEWLDQLVREAAEGELSDG